MNLGDGEPLERGMINTVRSLVVLWMKEEEEATGRKGRQRVLQPAAQAGGS